MRGSYVFWMSVAGRLRYTFYIQGDKDSKKDDLLGLF